MNRIIKITLLVSCFSSSIFAGTQKELQQQIALLQKQTHALEVQLARLQKEVAAHHHSHKSHHSKQRVLEHKPSVSNKPCPLPNHLYHSTQISVHTPEIHPESFGFYPTALVANHKILTYIAGTPVVTSPYLGSRPAFDGSDYIVNISSINRDIRLMQQRRRLYQAYKSIGYPAPPMPIIALSGKAEPIGVLNHPYRGNMSGDINLGTNELDVAAALNQNVEAFMSLAYSNVPPAVGPRVNNSVFNLNMGFVNIGNLDRTPLYFTAGQLYVPFGRYATAMVSQPLTLILARTKARPFILGYKSQQSNGPFAAAYLYRGDTTLGKSGVGGANLGYVFQTPKFTGEIGASYLSSINDAAGMQVTGSNVYTTFAGFGSLTNGSEAVRKVQAMGVHGNVGYDRFNLSGEWVGAIQGFRPQDLSYNGHGAKPAAATGELDMTFMAFNRPSSIGVSYQWSKEALALNLPQQRFSGVFNISIWKDTVESLEYRHDLDYGLNQFANGAAPPGLKNANTLGTGRSADTLLAQIGVYF
jgi:hypothetical protein